MSTTRIELAPDSGYRLTVTSRELGVIREALDGLASWMREHMGDAGAERVLEIEALRIAIDQARAELP
jgi:hypothetical protein